MDTVLEQKLAILSQAVLIWLVSFICYLFFFSVSWGFPALYATLSVLVIALISYFMIWLNLSIERTSTVGGVLQAGITWVIICIVIDLAAHLQIHLIEFNLPVYLYDRGWHFLVIIPTTLIAWMVFKLRTRGDNSPQYTRFIGRRR